MRGGQKEMKYILEEYRRGKWMRISTCENLEFLAASALQLGYRTGASGYPHPQIRVRTEKDDHRGGNI